MTAFETSAEVEAYLSGDRITCLICGRSFRGVCHHAAKAHGVSATEYKLRFGIAVTRGVCGAGTRAAMRAAQKRICTPEVVAERVVRLQGARQLRRCGGEYPPYARDAAARMAIRSHGRERKLDERDFAAVVAAIRAGQTAWGACHTAGLPGCAWLYQQIVADPARRAAWDAMWESLPFKQQAASKKLGRRFADAVAERRALGMSYPKIAADLGVSEYAVKCRCSRAYRKRKKNQDR